MNILHSSVKKSLTDHYDSAEHPHTHKDVYRGITKDWSKKKHLHSYHKK